MFSLKMLGFLFIFSANASVVLKDNNRNLEVSYNTASYNPIDVKDRAVFNTWTKAINSTIKSR